MKPPVRVFHGRARTGERWAAISSLLRDRFDLGDDASREAGRDPAVIARNSERFQAAVRAVADDDQAVELLHFLGGFVGLEFPPSPFLRVISDSQRQKDDIARTVLRRFLEHGETVPYEQRLDV